ncbi:MAG: hypothetical protein AB1486_14215 [Planctomycetota bacterium]
MNPLLGFLLCSVFLGSATAVPVQEDTSAAAVSASVRDLDLVLDLVLGGRTAQPPERALFLLLDATPSLVTARFAERFEQALGANADRLTNTTFCVARVGARKLVVLPWTTDLDAVGSAVRSTLAETTAAFQNVYADVREAADMLARRPGLRELVLVTLDNGDAEDDLEGMADKLQRAKVRFTAIGSESYLADSYWARNSGQQAPQDCDLTGGDSPIIDLPWGFLFQYLPVNEVTPSGFGMYGLNRLAAVTGGKVFLYAPAEAGTHHCTFYGLCPFCAGDHLATEESYFTPRLLALAPTTTPRSEAYRTLSRDPIFRAVVAAWRSAAEEGLVLSMPPVKLTGTSSRPQHNRWGRSLPIFGSLQFDRHAQRADAAAVACGRILERLDADLAALTGDAGGPRQRAIGELMQILLQLTKVNLVTFSGFCREIAPGLVSARPPELEPPEVDSVDRESRPVGIWYLNLSLCHGVRPFLDLDLPGGDALGDELLELDRRARDFLERHANTPFAVAFCRSGIARFYLTYPGITGAVQRVRPSSTSQTGEGPATLRPTRAGGTSDPGKAGPTTGGRDW